MSGQVNNLAPPIKNKKFFKQLSLKQLSVGTIEVEDKHLYVSTSPLSSSRTKKNETKSKIMKYNIEDHSEVWSHTYEDKINNSLNISSLLIKKLIPTEKYLYVIGGGGYNKTHESVSHLYCNHFILKIDNKTGKKIELNEFKDRIICSATLDNNSIYVATLLRENNDFVVYKYDLDKLDKNSMKTHLDDNKTNIFQSKFEKFSTRINIYVKNNIIYRGYDVSSKKKYIPKGKTRERDVPRTKLDKIDIKNKKIEKIISLDGGDTFNFQVMNNDIYTLINNNKLTPNESLYNSSIPAKINLGDDKIEMKYDFSKEEFEEFVEDKKNSPKTNSILIKYGLIFSACNDGIIRVYDDKNGKLVNRILHNVNTAKPSKTKDLNNIAFIEANDKYLYTAVYDGIIMRWKFSDLPIISDYVSKNNKKEINSKKNDKKKLVKNVKNNNVKNNNNDDDDDDDDEFPPDDYFYGKLTKKVEDVDELVKIMSKGIKKYKKYMKKKEGVELTNEELKTTLDLWFEHDSLRQNYFDYLAEPGESFDNISNKIIHASSKTKKTKKMETSKKTKTTKKTETTKKTKTTKNTKKIKITRNTNDNNQLQRSRVSPTRSSVSSRV